MALSDSELLLQAKSGNDAAFEELIYRYDRSVLAIALKYVHDTDEAKDIYQEVFIRVYRGLKNFEMKSEFSTWLFRIATNVCLTHKSRSKKHLQHSIDEQITTEDDEVQKYELADVEMDPGEILINLDLGDIIRSAVDSLSAKQRMTFILKHYEGYKIREIADMLNCKEGTVKKYLFDAIRNLRKKLKPIHQIA
ncbi:MAG: RNA polymerase sigma factor [Ignavibacteria bacterium]|nr:MAG: RNA polymerase sigma factor [Ignavibacteria bacterium]